ncbi:acyl carrier protein [Kitasatospora sp. NPDC057015]|uniref:acyl carrier protein n=1 Tax=Kitasatospora sp. NPDC057015 TaxID=3346001 RepID=UPI00363E319D
MTDIPTAATAPGGLRTALAALAADACDGEPSATELLAAASTPFVLLGVGSLAQLRLLDAVESTYGVYFDLAGPNGFPGSLDALAENLVAEHGVTHPEDTA